MTECSLTAQIKFPSARGSFPQAKPKTRSDSETEKLINKSHNGQGDAADFLIDVEGVDVGHAADIVDDGHETCFQIGGIDVVLTADTADELFRVEAVRMMGSLNEMRHQRLHDLIARQFHIKDRTALIDAFDGKRCTVFISLAGLRGDMIDERAIESTVEKIVFMLDKHLHTFIL